MVSSTIKENNTTNYHEYPIKGQFVLIKKSKSESVAHIWGKLKAQRMVRITK